MEPWSRRPVEIANLLNPAFCGEIVRRSVLKYETEVGEGMPYLLTFLLLPLITKKSIRTLIPTAGAPTFHGWVQAHPEIKIDFAHQTEQLAPFTKEAILFLLQNRKIAMGSGGLLSVVDSSRPDILQSRFERHPHNFFKKSEKVGKWFASAGGTSAIYTTLGVRP